MGCLNSLGSQRKGGLRDRFRGLAWDKLPLPIAALVASLIGTIRVCLPVGEGEEGVGCSPEGEAMCWVLCLRAGILGEVSGRVSVKYSSILQAFSFSARAGGP